VGQWNNQPSIKAQAGKQFASNLPGFALVQAHSELMAVKFLDTDGNILHSTSFLPRYFSVLSNGTDQRTPNAPPSSRIRPVQPPPEYEPVWQWMKAVLIAFSIALVFVLILGAWLVYINIKPQDPHKKFFIIDGSVDCMDDDFNGIFVFNPALDARQDGPATTTSVTGRLPGGLRHGTPVAQQNTANANISGGSSEPRRYRSQSSMMGLLPRKIFSPIATFSGSGDANNAAPRGDPDSDSSHA
jgi:hypothetical protein